jgi:hypothetical protein
VLGRRLVGGSNEKQIQGLFASVCLAQSVDSEPGDVDIVKGQFLEEDNKEDYEYTPRRRYQYSCEQELAVIDYFQTI